MCCPLSAGCRLSLSAQARNNELAQYFGAEVFEAETGEINVVTKMHQLEEQGYFVPIGIEGYNGGSILFGTEVRDGTLVGLLAGLVLSDRSVFNTLQATLNRPVVEDTYNFVDVLEALPRYYTRQRNLKGEPMPPRDIKTGLEVAFNELISLMHQGYFNIFQI